jgi:16S rRNA (uracil1498-N3)-methyltransferase
MRAHYQLNLMLQEDYLIQGESAHHLLNVVRVEPGEEILLLNGKGLMVWARIETVSKREIKLKKLKDHFFPPSSQRDLILGIPKKEALELSLKEAVELGFRRIFLVRSAYSQIKFPESDRLQNLLESALEQSNAAYMPTLFCLKWDEIPFHEFSQVMVLDSQLTSTAVRSEISSLPVALVVGPEGGFSPDEQRFLYGLANVVAVRLPCPILRTPTAVAAGAGLLMARLLD